MSYDLVQSTDAHMTRSRFFLPRGTHFYPSEASVKWTDAHGIERCDGKCLRAAWYRLTGKGEYVAPDAGSEWIFALGKAVEEILVEQWKQMGIWIDNNIRFYDKAHNLSGELDAVLRDPTSGELFGVEVKSFYGYQGKKQIMGNKSQAGAPKTAQMLQCLLYVYFCKRLFDEGVLPYEITHFKLVYYARDSSARRSFDLSIQDINGMLRPTVDNVVDYRFTIQDILNRYLQMAEYMKNGENPPPRDYEKAYSIEKVEKLNALGEISKTAYEKWVKSPAKNPIGDWQCAYCPYQKFCYSDDTPEQEVPKIQHQD